MMPPLTKINCSSPPPAGTMRTAPGLMRVMSGVWRGRMPSSPASPGSATNFASPEKMLSSAETTSTWMVCGVVAMAACPYWIFFAFSKASSIVPTM